MSMWGFARTISLVLALTGLLVAIIGSNSTLNFGIERFSATDLPVVQTESPQQTLRSFDKVKSELESARERYQRERTQQNFVRILGLVDELIFLIDLSDFPEAVARRNAVVTAMSLLEIWELISPIDLVAVPDEAAMRNKGFSSYTVPGTPLRLGRIADGPREGEFVFDGSTVRIAPRFLNGLKSETPETRTTRWREVLEQFAGPWIPINWIDALPPSLKRSVFGTPAWKVLATVAIGLSIALVMGLIRKALPISAGFLLLSPISRLLFSASFLPLLLFSRYLISSQIGVTGEFADWVRGVFIFLWFGSIATIFWNATLAMEAAFFSSKEENVDASNRSLLQLVAHMVGLVGAVWIISVGLQALGVPVFSLLAGLGIGGLAVALAVRPTLENLIGGLVIYISKPVRVGDWCEFGAHSGTVERIGVRSTSVRAMDRTRISIPNSQFSNMELVNWAQCDQMLINPTIGLIYGTTSDQLRYVLAETRRMAHSHPKIDSETVRIRFAGYGDSSLDISVRIYAQTTEWNEFYAVREDVFLRLKEIVEAAGTSFAFPSRSLYVAREKGLHPSRTEAAEKAVESWRRRHDLPFPNFSESARGKMSNSLEYPPIGSPDRGVGQSEIETVSEPLSSDFGNDIEKSNP